MQFTETQIQSLAPNPAAFSAGKKLSSKEQWQSFATSDRAIWGAIKGSGASPYLTQVDMLSLAYKCTCPSRQFPCKHGIGLMLLHVTHASAFPKQQEPEWVQSWMDKRVVKEKTKVEEKERTEEEIEQLEKNREKTQQNRLASVVQGADELELWLKDLVRIGLLELRVRDSADYHRMAARMVDAKAPGLAGWVRALGNVDTDDDQRWQQDVLTIIAKTFLLVSAIRNYSSLSPLWQQTVRNLSGWSQSTKELLADTEAQTVKDQWLVVGQEVESTTDDIIIQRNWLLGLSTNQQALILNFGTKFSPIENNVIPGTLLEAELVFFPSVLPQRAAIKIQRNVSTHVSAAPTAFRNITEVHQFKVAQLRINPWANDLVVVIDRALLTRHASRWVVCDEELAFLLLSTSFTFEKVTRWLAMTGNQRHAMVLVLRQHEALPLGIFIDNHYHLL